MKALDFIDALQCRPLHNHPDFLWIHFKALSRDNIANKNNMIVQGVDSLSREGTSITCQRCTRWSSLLFAMTIY